MSLIARNIIYYCSVLCICLFVFKFRKATADISITNIPDLTEAEDIFRDKVNLAYKRIVTTDTDDDYLIGQSEAFSFVKLSVDSVCYAIYHVDSLSPKKLSELMDRAKKRIQREMNHMNTPRFLLDESMALIDKGSKFTTSPCIPALVPFRRSLQCISWYKVMLKFSDGLRGNYSTSSPDLRFDEAPESSTIYLGDTFKTSMALSWTQFYNIHDIKTTINGQYYPSSAGVIEWTAPPQKPGKYYYTVHTTAKVWDTDSIIENKARFYYLVR